MKNDTAFVVGIVLVLGVLALGGWYYSRPQVVIVTQPDGTVTQIPITQTPTQSTSTPQNPQVVTAAGKINQPVVINGVTIRPTQLLEDSRCPASVVCIQAGTVRVQALVTDTTGATTADFKLGTPLIIRNSTIQLIMATPEKISTSTIAAADYTFYFQVATN